jgi:Xaa-Pro aminopeptidase
MSDLTKAIKITEQCFMIVRKLINVGVTEKQLDQKLRKYARYFGADRLAFPPIVSFGSKQIHPKPTNRKLKERDLIIIDFGVICGKSRTDVTRTYCLKPNKKQKQLYDLIKRAQKLAEKKIRPGVSCSKVDLTARRYLKKHSRMKFPYGLGHGLKRKIHDKPRISPKSKDVFKVGDVFTLEPGLHSKKTGLRIEDMYLLTRKRIIKLTNDISSDLNGR